jgi:hypothetical protein
VLEVVGRVPGTGEHVVMAGFGLRADWPRNALAGGAREVVVGRRRFRPGVRLLDKDEAVEALAATSGATERSPARPPPGPVPAGGTALHRRR